MTPGGGGEAQVIKTSSHSPTPAVVETALLLFCFSVLIIPYSCPNASSSRSSTLPSQKRSPMPDVATAGGRAQEGEAVLGLPPRRGEDRGLRPHRRGLQS